MEHQFHHWLRSQPKDAASLTNISINTGIGDDAAVIDFAGQPLIVTTDAIAEGTHFRLPIHASAQEPRRVAAFERIGRKALAVSLSDIAAMGARPVAATLNFQCPKALSVEDIQAIYNGANKLATKYGLAIVGGDTNTWQDGLVVSSTVFGTRTSKQKGWSLNGAKSGDVIYVSGEFGGSIHGRHFDFEPRLALASCLATGYQVNSATDASDSLTSDLMAIAQASSVAMEINLDAVPISPDVQASEDKSLLEHALTDGEDFELIFTVSPDDAAKLDQAKDLPTPVTRLGSVQTGSPALYDNKGQQILVSGYEH